MSELLRKLKNDQLEDFSKKNLVHEIREHKVERAKVQYQSMIKEKKQNLTE